MVCIVGCCHPKARPEGYVGEQLTWGRMRNSWKSLIGRPLLDNHNTGRKVGRVLDAWVDGQQQLWIRAEVDEGSAMGRQVAQQIRSGEYQGLSLGMSHGVVTDSTASCSGSDPSQGDWDTVREVLWSDITEVSVCPRGKYPDTVLHTYFSEDPDQSGSPGSVLGLSLALAVSSQQTTPTDAGKNNTGKRGHKPLAAGGSINKSRQSRRVFEDSVFTGFFPPNHLCLPSISSTTTTTMSNQATPPATTVASTPGLASPSTTTTAGATTVPATTTPSSQAPATGTAAKGTAKQPETTTRATPTDPKAKDTPAAAAAEAGTDATKKDGTKAADSQSHALALARLEMQKFRQQQAADAAEMKKLQAEKRKLEHTVSVYSASTRMLHNTGDETELAKLAEARRTKILNESHAQAQALLPTLQDWLGAAQGESRSEMAVLARNIEGFVRGDDEIRKNPTLLNTTIGTARVLHAIKSHGDQRLSAEQAKTGEAQKLLAETRTALEKEQQSHLKAKRDLETLQRQIQLVEHAAGGAVPAAPVASGLPAMATGGLGNSMGFDGAMKRATLQSVASDNSSAVTQAANSVIGSLLGTAAGSQPPRAFGTPMIPTALPGNKRPFAQTQVKKTVASDTAPVASPTAPPAKRSRMFAPLYENHPQLPIQGNFGSGSNMQVSASLQDFTLAIGEQYKNGQGRTGGSNYRVEVLEGSLENSTTLPPGYRSRQRMRGY